MPTIVVVDHHHDEFEEVYRLVLGVVEEREVPAVDDHGEPVFEPGETRMEDGEEIVLPGRPMMTVVSEIVSTEEFVFAAHDKQWEGKSAEEIAGEQREIVKRALVERDWRTAPSLAEMTTLPGVGEAL